MSRLTRCNSHYKDFMPRTPFLQSMQGWYETSRSPLGELYQASGSKLKFSRWLTANGVTEPRTVKALIETDKPVTFKVSCEYNDILRCSVTNHYDSCLKPEGCNSQAPPQYCRHVPNVAIVYVADKSGKFAGRFFIVHLHYKGVDYVVPARVYGNIPAFAMMTALEKKFKMAVIGQNSLFYTDEYSSIAMDYHTAYTVYKYSEAYPVHYKVFVRDNKFSLIPRDKSRFEVTEEDRQVNKVYNLLVNEKPYFDAGAHFWVGYNDTF